MKNPTELVTGSALLVSWAVLLGSRYIAAGLLMVGKNYDNPAVGFGVSLNLLGWFLPLCAWLSFAGACLLLLRAWFGRKEV
jgi:hypothetical protein